MDFIQSFGSKLEFVHKISENIYLLGYEDKIIIIPIRPENVVTEIYQKNPLDRLISLEEMRIKYKPGIIMSNHHPIGEINCGDRINMMLSDGVRTLFVHFMKSDPNTITNFTNQIKFNQIKIIDHGNAVIAWITPQSEENSQVYQLYNLSSDLIGSALIIK